MKKSSIFDGDVSIENNTDIGPIPSNEESRNQLENGTGVVCNSKYVNLRRSPIANGQVIDVLENGDRGVIVEKVSGFYKIKVIKNGKIGYIAEHYFREE